MAVRAEREVDRLAVAAGEGGVASISWLRLPTPRRYDEIVPLPMAVGATSPPGIVVSYAGTTPDLSEKAVDRLIKAAGLVDQVTPRMEAAAAESAIRWHRTEDLPAP